MKKDGLQKKDDKKDAKKMMKKEECVKDGDKKKKVNKWWDHSLTHSGVFWWTPMMAFHILLSCMHASISWVVKPVSWWSRSTKVLVGRPADLLPWVGLHVTSSDTIFPSLLLQWPANCSLLLLIWVVILGRSPYNSLLVIWSFQLTSSAFLSIRV